MGFFSAGDDSKEGDPDDDRVTNSGASSVTGCKSMFLSVKQA